TGASGASLEMKNGNNVYVIQQSVGQPSIIGTVREGEYVLRQGFIQPDILSRVAEKNMPLNLQLSLHPNPFQEQISLVFNEEIKGEINITVYNILGALIYTKNYQSNQRI